MFLPNIRRIRVALMISIMVVVGLVLVIVVRQETPLKTFSIFNDITWNTTPDEIEKKIGKKAEWYGDEDSEYGYLQVLVLEDIELHDYQVERVGFSFFDHKLFSVQCNISNKEVNDTTEFIAKFSSVYGVPKLKDGNTLLNFVDGTNALCEWKVGDDTGIVFVRMEKNRQSEEYYYISYLNLDMQNVIQNKLFVPTNN